jgi:hypothetical protein
MTIRFSNNIVFKIPVIRSRPDVYSTLVAVIQNEIKSGIEEKKTGTVAVPENPNEIGKVEDEQDEEDDEEEDCLRIIEETMVDPKSLPGRKKTFTILLKNLKVVKSYPKMKKSKVNFKFDI